MSQTSSTPSLLLAVAAGSALGGVARLLLSQSVQERWSTPFPAGTLAVNAMGCFVLGFLAELMLATGAFSPGLRAFLTIGFCGGFTTFSTFASETMLAAEEGALRRASWYVGTSVVAGLAGIWLGATAARLLLGFLRRGG